MTGLWWRPLEDMLADPWAKEFGGGLDWSAPDPPRSGGPGASRPPGVCKRCWDAFRIMYDTSGLSEEGF